MKRQEKSQEAGDLRLTATNGENASIAANEIEVIEIAMKPVCFLPVMRGLALA